jgi:hypothetical protein
VAKASGAAEAPLALVASNAVAQRRAIVPAKSEMTASNVAADRAEPQSAEAKQANPQVWLREIEALRAAGKTDEAERQLAEFRKAFPNEATQLPATRDSRPVQ